jgi:DNA processing protein
MEGLKKEILLSFFPKITFKRYSQILAFFNSLEEFWLAEKKELLKIKWEEKIIDEFLLWKKEIDEEKIIKTLETEEIECLTLSDESYPRLLKQIYDPPICLFIKGKLGTNNIFLSIVGSRKNSLYGKQITEKISHELAQRNISIVSGLAFGIDSIAHRSCLKAKGKTIAVLGSGLHKNFIYPKEHYELAKEVVASGGALISEYPPETKGDFFTFPRRNRIIAGISTATLIIEAQKKSGALTTANFALENGREIFCIPQNINSLTSEGTNELLKNGANLVTSSDDILDALNLQLEKKCVKNNKIQAENEQEEIILKHLDKTPLHIDKIIKKTGLSSQTVNSTLSFMEIKGMIENLGNMTYILKN